MSGPVNAERWCQARWCSCQASASAAAAAAGSTPSVDASRAARAAPPPCPDGSKISVDTVVQEGVEDEFRGRVFSLYDTLFNVMFVAAAVVGSMVLPESGKSYAVVAFIAAGYAVTSVAYRLAGRKV